MVVIAACHGQGGHGNLGGDNLEKLGQDSGRIHVIRNFNVTDVKCIENLQDQVKCQKYSLTFWYLPSFIYAFYHCKKI